MCIYTPVLLPGRKQKQKQKKNLNIRCDTIKLLEENIGKTFSNINRTSVILDQSPKDNRNKNKNK